MRGRVPTLLRLGWLSLERTMLADRAGPVEELLEGGFVADEPSRYCLRCGRDVGPGEFVQGACSGCKDKKLPWGGLVRLGAYDGALREAVHEFKFNRWHVVGEHLGRALGAAVSERLHAVAADAGEPASAILSRSIVVPVPMSIWRRASRGIDHATCLGRAVAVGAGLPFARLLVRQHRPAQTGLSAAARRRNLRGAMRPRVGSEALRGVRVVVLVDDVMTTGATLAEACRVVKSMVPRPGPDSDPGPAVLAATVAVSDPGRRRPVEPLLTGRPEVVVARSPGVQVQKK